MPGSLPIETYAATLAARRTSGAASRTSARSRAAAPTSATRSRLPGGGELVAEGQFGAGLGGGHPASLRSEVWVVQASTRRATRCSTRESTTVAVETFAHYYRLLEHGETGMIPEVSPSSRSTWSGSPTSTVDDEVAAEAIRHTVVIKLNGVSAPRWAWTGPSRCCACAAGCRSSTSSPGRHCTSARSTTPRCRCSS